MPSAAGVGLQDFDVLGALGSGSTAEVLLVRKTGLGNTLHAMKMISKASLGSTRAVEQVIEENKILQTLRHPFIVGLHYAFQDTSHFFFVLTYAGGGDLLTFLELRGQMVESTARLVTAEVVLALQHLVRATPPAEPPRRFAPEGACPRTCPRASSLATAKRRGGTTSECAGCVANACDRDLHRAPPCACETPTSVPALASRSPARRSSLESRRASLSPSAFTPPRAVHSLPLSPPASVPTAAAPTVFDAPSSRSTPSPSSIGTSSPKTF